MKRKMEKEWLPHIIAVGAFVVFIVLGLACASTPTTQIDLDSSYQKYLQQISGQERRIDIVGVRGNSSFVCRDPSHKVTSEQQLGASYSLGGEYTSKKKAAEAEAPVAEKHRHQAILDQLLSLAKKEYPSEKGIDIRSGRTSGHIPTNPRLEEYQQRGTDGNYYTATRTVWDCVPQYEAIVITTEKAPAKNFLDYDERFTKAGTTREKFSRIVNWLRDEKTSGRVVVIENRDDATGRIEGTLAFDVVASDHTYKITSNYTVDVYDSEVVIKLREAGLQRTDPSLSRLGGREDIFLQSIADAAKAEIVKFAASLRSF